MDNNTIQTLLLFIQILTLGGLIFYALETWKMASATKKSVEVAEKSLHEMREQRDAEIAPYIVAYLDAQGEINGLLYLVIKNTGKTVAKNVKIKFDPPLKTLFPEDLQKVLPVDGIPSFPPDYEIRTTLGRFMDYNNTEPMAFTVELTYFGGINDKPRQDKYYIDLTWFKGIVTSIETKPLNEIAQELKKIQSSSEMIVEELEKMNDRISQKRKIRKSINRRNQQLRNLSNKTLTGEQWFSYMRSWFQREREER